MSIVKLHIQLSVVYLNWFFIHLITYFVTSCLGTLA